MKKVLTKTPAADSLDDGSLERLELMIAAWHVHEAERAEELTRFRFAEYPPETAAARHRRFKRFLWQGRSIVE